MSKTDKTTPWWVYVEQHGVERHNHQWGPCDFDKFDKRKPWMTRCGLTVTMTYKQSLKYFGKPHRAHNIENVLERKFRRQTKQAIGRRDADNAPTKHLDSAWLID